jgi:hypothetical protein
VSTVGSIGIWLPVNWVIMGKYLWTSWDRIFPFSLENLIEAISVNKKGCVHFKSKFLCF